MNVIPIIQAQHLKKTFFSKVTDTPIQALNDVSIEVHSGEIFGILGPNGAGKTTLLNCLSLLVEPDQGEISLFGNNVKKMRSDIKKRINMSSGNANFGWCMTVKEILKFYGYLYGLSGKKLSSRIDKLIEILNLSHFVYRRFDECSTGTKQRLSLAKALINSPEILFLDEPTVGLDPDVSIKIRHFIQEINQKEKVTILLTTHYMTEAEQLSHRIAFLQNGKILTEGTPTDLKQKLSANNMEEVFIQLSKDRT